MIISFTTGLLIATFLHFTYYGKPVLRAADILYECEDPEGVCLALYSGRGEVYVRNRGWPISSGVSVSDKYSGDKVNTVQIKSVNLSAVGYVGNAAFFSLLVAPLIFVVNKNYARNRH